MSYVHVLPTRILISVMTDFATCFYVCERLLTNSSSISAYISESCRATGCLLLLLCGLSALSGEKVRLLKNMPIRLSIEPFDPLLKTDGME